MNSQNELDFGSTHFGGSDYNPKEDLERMSECMGRVFEVMCPDPERWFFLEELSKLSAVPQSSVGSYLCYLRRDFDYEVPKEHIENGLYRYKLGKQFTEEQKQARRIQKMKPIGDKELFGQMMRSIYAHANDPEENTIPTMMDMDMSVEEWKNDLVSKVSRGVL